MLVCQDTRDRATKEYAKREAQEFYGSTMSSTQGLTELNHLSHSYRREIARRLIELEEEAQTLADCDARADASFQLLDALEAEIQVA